MDYEVWIILNAGYIIQLIMQQHQHGPNCRHGQGGHGHGHGHGAPQLQQMAPQDYFKQLLKKFNNNRVFFWHQVMMGLSLDKLYQKYGLNFMRSLSCNTALMIVASLQSAINFDFVPKQLKHVASGLFFPILFLLFFNFNVVVGIGNDNEPLHYLLWTTIIVFLLTGFRGSGELNNSQNKQKCKNVYAIRPYLQNPSTTCTVCGIIKVFRSTHCPFCKSCVTKHTRHSVVFGMCIGAANEFFAMLFFMLFWLTESSILYLFFTTNTYGLITKIMFYLMNGCLCWMSFTQFATLLIFNLWYGITEQELKTWMMQQYLIKVPEREFENNVGQGFVMNLVNSLSAAFGISGFESEPTGLPNPLAFPPIDPSRTYRINWAKASIYLVPFLPTHKNRQQITQLLQRQQPRMIEMYKLQQQFRAQIVQQKGNENLNEFQIQQKLAMKMQAYVMKNMPHMMQQHQQQPTSDQQRTIQLQMLSHMKKQFASQPDLAPQIEHLHHQLSQSKLTPIEANLKMRQLQQQLMQRRMSKVMKQHQEQTQQTTKKREEDEQAPMAGVADEDL